MLQWQFIVLFTLLLTTMSLAGPADGDDPKMCFHISGYDNGKCMAYCISKKKRAGSCQKKRCVCIGGESDEDDDNDERRRRDLSFSTEQPSPIYLKACQAYCKNIGQNDGSFLNGLCVCSKK